jgi:hypothetical protein
MFKTSQKNAQRRVDKGQRAFPGQKPLSRVERHRAERYKGPVSTMARRIAAESLAMFGIGRRLSAARQPRNSPIRSPAQRNWWVNGR